MDVSSWNGARCKIKIDFFVDEERGEEWWQKSVACLSVRLLEKRNK